MLDWYINVNHAPLLIAEQKGFFKKHHLNVKILVPSDPTEPAKLVAAGKVDIAIDYLPSFLLAKQRHLPLMQIGSLLNRPLGCLVVLKENKINNIHDLRGKRIAYSSPAIDILILKTMLKKNGLTINDVKLVNVHYALVQGILSKRVDAAIGLMRNVEPVQFKLLNKPITVFYPEENGTPFYNELIFIAKENKKNLQEHQQFLLALKEAVAYLIANPQEAWITLIKAYPELNNELAKNAWTETLTYFVTNPSKYDAQQSLQVLKWINQE